MAVTFTGLAVGEVPEARLTLVTLLSVGVGPAGALPRELVTEGVLGACRITVAGCMSGAQEKKKNTFIPSIWSIYCSAKNTRGRRAIRPRALKYSLRQKLNEGDFFFFFLLIIKLAPIKFADRLLQNVTSKHNINFWTFKLWKLQSFISDVNDKHPTFILASYGAECYCHSSWIFVTNVEKFIHEKIAATWEKSAKSVHFFFFFLNQNLGCALYSSAPYIYAILR